MGHFFWKRRILSLLLTAAVIWALWIYLQHQNEMLQRSTFTSGYLLAIGVLFLAAFNLRKKLAFLPIASAATWLQLHIYVSFVVIALFVMHTGARFPNGRFESLLYGIFSMVAVSGVYGLYITRSIPARITKLREEVIYERIPALRSEVAKRAHQVVTDLLERTDAEPLADYYSQRLIPYFAGGRGALYYLRPTSRLRNRLQADLSTLVRYESVAERETQDKLRNLIDKRDDLDYHEAQQRKLKGWLFFHIAATYGLLLVGGLHVVLVLAFVGAGR